MSTGGVSIRCWRRDRPMSLASEAPHRPELSSEFHRAGIRKAEFLSMPKPAARLGRIAILWRGDEAARGPVRCANRWLFHWRKSAPNALLPTKPLKPLVRTADLLMAWPGLTCYVRSPCRSPVAVAKICSADTPVEDAGRSVLPSARHDGE